MALENEDLFQSVGSVIQVLRQNSKYAVELSGESYRMMEASHMRQQQAQQLARLSRETPAEQLAEFGQFCPKPFIQDFTRAGSDIERFLTSHLASNVSNVSTRRAKLFDGTTSAAGGPITEHPFVRDLIKLVSTSSGADDASPNIGEALLRPFCAIMEAGDTTGPLTGAALNALENLVSNGALDGSENLTETLGYLAAAVSNCKFETSDAQQDEIVLARLLSLIKAVLTRPTLLSSISNKSMCELIETSFGICFQTRASTLLKDLARDALATLVDVVADRFCQVTESLRGKGPYFEAATSTMYLPPLDAHRSFGIATAVEVLRVLLALSDVKDRPQHLVTGNRLISLYLLRRFVKNCAYELSVWHAWGKELHARASTMLRNGNKVLEKRAASTRNETLTIHTRAHPRRSSVKPLSGGVISTTENVQDAAYSATPPSAGTNADEAATSEIPPLLNGDKFAEDRLDVKVNADVDTPLPEYSQSLDASEERNGLYDSVTDERGNSEESVNEPFTENELQLVALNLSSLIEFELFRLLFFVLKTTDAAQSFGYNYLRVIGDVLQIANLLFPHFKFTHKSFYSWLFEYFVVELDAGISSHSPSGDVKQTSALPTVPEILVSGKRTAPINGLFREQLWLSVMQWSRYPDLLDYLLSQCDGRVGIPSLVTFSFVELIARHSLPEVGQQTPITMPIHQQYAFHSLFNFVQAMYSNEANATDDHLKLLNDSLNQKMLLHQAANEFNRNPKEGLKFLVKHSLIKSIDDHDSLIKFLATTPGVSKKELGEFISRPEQLTLLAAFIKQLNFSNKRIDEALRLLLEQFRLPGEAQQIGRIMETFSEQYFKTVEPGTFANADAAYVLSYSIILLNTDQHNPRVRKPMTLEEFTRNVRGINDGKNFDGDYIAEIYNSIHHSEIVMPGEHQGTPLGLKHAFRELLAQVPYPTETSALIPNCSKSIFVYMWPFILNSFSYYFDVAEDDLSIKDSALGFCYFARLAAKFDHTASMESLLNLLSNSTGISQGYGRYFSQRSLRKNPSPSEGPVDQFGINMGSSMRQQIALKLYLALTLEYRDFLGSASFLKLVENLQCLFFHGYLPLEKNASPPLVEMPPVSSLLVLLTKPYAAQKQAYYKMVLQQASQRPSANQKRSDGLFSTISQLITMTASGFSDKAEHEIAPPDEVDAEQHFAQLLKDWNALDIVERAKFSSGDALRHLLKALSLLSFQKSAHSAEGKEILELSPSAGVMFHWITTLVLNNADNLSLVIDVFETHLDSLLSAFVRAFFANDTPSGPVTSPVPVSPELVQQERKGGIPSLALMELVIIKFFSLYDPVDPDKTCETLSKWLWSKGLVYIRRFGELPGVSVPVLTPEPFLVPFEVSPIIETLQKCTSSVQRLHRETIYKEKALDSFLKIFLSARADPAGAQYAFDGLSYLFSPLLSADFKSYIQWESDALTFAFDAAMTFISVYPFERLAMEMQARLIQAKSMLQGQQAYEQTVQDLRTRKRELLQGALERAISALSWISKMCPGVIDYLGSTSQLNAERLWYEYWLRVLTGLAQQLSHPFRDVRQQSVSLLQRFLLSDSLFCDTCGGKSIERDVVVSDCFEHVLFPLLDDLSLRDAPFALSGAELEDSLLSLHSRSTTGNVTAIDSSEQIQQQRLRTDLDEMQARVAGLSCKVFLHHAVYLFENVPNSSERVTQWSLRLLGYMAKFLKIGQELHDRNNSDYLYEAILESLKNMLLVLHAQNLFSHGNFFKQTIQAVQAFSPSLIDDVFHIDKENPPESLPLTANLTLSQKESEKVSVPLPEQPQSESA